MRDTRKTKALVEIKSNLNEMYNDYINISQETTWVW